jgi:long-chain fatty acid transport protein
MQTAIKTISVFLLLLVSMSVFGQDEICDPFAGCQPDIPDGAPSSDFSGLPIDLLPPGARSLGLGGAFTGVADDATAAIANPAGLSILTAKEISLHVRNSDSDVDFFDPDAYDSTLWGAETGRLNKQYTESKTNVSFASFVLPFDRWVLSAYYTSQLDFQSLQTGGPDVVYDSVFVVTYHNDNSVESSMDGYGLSTAFRVTDSFSLGLTIQQSSLDVVSVDRWQLDDFFDNEFVFGTVFPELGTVEEWAEVIIDEYITETTIDDSDSDTNFSVGMMYSPNSNWSFGLLYREGAEYEFDTRVEQIINFGCAGSGEALETCNVFLSTDTIVEAQETTTTIKIPDTITLGIGWRPTDTLLISFDINSIGYSDSSPVRSFTQGFGLDVNGETQLTEEIKDGTTFHVGVEKVFVLQNNNTFSIRGGAFTIEDHDGNRTIDSSDTAFTLGVGTTLGSEGQFQMDLGASFADSSTNIILSGIYRF